MKERIVYADYIRVIACFLVMLIHACELFYTGGIANESNRLWVSIYDGMSRIAVPLFIIISSILLVPMPEDMEMGAFYKRRFTKILPPLLFFLVLYAILPAVWGETSWERVWTAFKRIPWNFPMNAGHLWFMYPLISLYLIIPVVSPWLRKASAKDERLFLAVFFISTFMPFIHRFISKEVWGECFWNGFHALWYCSGYLGYLVLAHYIRFHLKWDDRKKRTIGWIAFLAGGIFTAWSFYYKGVPGVRIPLPMLEWAWEFCTPNVVIATFGAFLLLSGIKKPQTPRLIRELSGLSFGMYLMHIFLLNVWGKWLMGPGGHADPTVPVFLAIPLIAIGTFVTTALISKLISLLPGSKWVIGI